MKNAVTNAVKSRLSVCVVAPTLFVLASCGSGGSSSSTDSTSIAGISEPSPTAPPNGGFNDEDVMFAQMMIPHHEQALEMSDIALDPTVGASAKVVELATAIKGAQDPEIAQMRQFLAEWGMPETPDQAIDHSSMMKGMLTVDELDALATLRGAEFDVAWAKAMIDHHEGAIDMAEAVIAGGMNEAALTLARAIASAQASEIRTLTAIAG